MKDKLLARSKYNKGTNKWRVICTNDEGVSDPIGNFIDDSKIFFNYLEFETEEDAVNYILGKDELVMESESTDLKVYGLNKDAVSEWFAAKTKEDALKFAEKWWGMDAYQEYKIDDETREEFIDRFCEEEDLDEDFEFDGVLTTFRKLIKDCTEPQLIAVENY